MKTPVKPAKDGISIALYAQPSASRTEWTGLIARRVQAADRICLSLGLTASDPKPIDGEANKEVCRFLSDYFEVAKRNVAIEQRTTGSNNVVTIAEAPDSLLAKANSLFETPNADPDTSPNGKQCCPRVD